MNTPFAPRVSRMLAAIGVLLAAACSEPNAPTTPTPRPLAGRVPLVASPRPETADVEYVEVCVFVPNNAFHPATFKIEYVVDLGADGTWDAPYSTTIPANGCKDIWVEGTDVMDNVRIDVVKPNPMWKVTNKTFSIYRPDHNDVSKDVYTIGPTIVGNAGALGWANGSNGTTVKFYFSDK